MQHYVAFISGLPAARQAVEPDKLRKLISKLGFLEVEIFPTADTVVFETAPVGLTDPLAAQISRHLRRSLGRSEIWTFIRTPEDLARIVAEVPFSSEEVEAAGSSLFVVLLSEPLDDLTARQLRIRRNEVDELRDSGKEIYWLRRPAAESVPPPALSEIIDAHATVRSFHTIRQLAGRFASMHAPERDKRDPASATESERSRR